MPRRDDVTWHKLFSVEEMLKCLEPLLVHNEVEEEISLVEQVSSMSFEGLSATHHKPWLKIQYKLAHERFKGLPPEQEKELLKAFRRKLGDDKSNSFLKQLVLRVFEGTKTSEPPHTLIKFQERMTEALIYFQRASRVYYSITSGDQGRRGDKHSRSLGRDVTLTSNRSVTGKKNKEAKHDEPDKAI